MAAHRSRARVLIAGNEPGIRLLTELLGDEFDVVAARSVGEALEKVSTAAPFHCVMDFAALARTYGAEQAKRILRSAIVDRP
jgi:CheY-like chemotaxis protein